MFSANLEESLPLYYSKIAHRRLRGGELLFVCGGSRHPSAAFLHPSLSLSLSQAIWLNLEGLSVTGPLKDMDFSVQEGGGPRILHQVIKCLVLSTLVKNPIACTQRPHMKCCFCAGGKNSPPRGSKFIF